MMGLFSPPAVILLFSRESTPVRLTIAAGHRLERTSLVTCREARTVSRATEICGLFFNASASASFNDRDTCIPGLVWEADGSCPFGDMVGEVWFGGACGVGAEGKVSAAFKLIAAWA